MEPTARTSTLYQRGESRSEECRGHDSWSISYSSKSRTKQLINSIVLPELLTCSMGPPSPDSWPLLMLSLDLKVRDDSSAEIAPRRLAVFVGTGTSNLLMVSLHWNRHVVLFRHRKCYRHLKHSCFNNHTRFCLRWLPRLIACLQSLILLLSALRYDNPFNKSRFKYSRSCI